MTQTATNVLVTTDWVAQHANDAFSEVTAFHDARETSTRTQR